MKFSIFGGLLISLIACSLHSNATAAVQEITVKNAGELTVTYDNGNTNQFRAPLFAGNVDQHGFSRLFQNFMLPENLTGSTLSSATLNFSYKNSVGSGRPLELLGSEGDWTTFNWYKQPKPTTGVLGLLPQSYVWKNEQIDVTDYINSVYKTGHAAGFLFRSSSENSNWSDAANFLPGQTLTLTFTSPVPEPKIYAMLLIGLGLISLVARRKRS
jgi:hypothetical protein